MRSVSVFVKCPFFCKEKDNQLRCEGFIEGTSMITRFPSRRDLLYHVSKKCIKVDGGNCVLAKNLYEKYRILEEKERQAELLKDAPTYSVPDRIKTENKAATVKKAEPQGLALTQSSRA